MLFTYKSLDILQVLINLTQLIKINRNYKIMIQLLLKLLKVKYIHK